MCDGAMSLEAETSERSREPWTVPTVRCLDASQAEQHSGAAPDGLGDQLS